MKMISWVTALAVVGMMAGAPTGARADLTYNLVTAGTLPSSPSYGTVTVKSVTGQPDELELVVQLSGTNHFANTGIDASFAFDLTGIGSITVSGLPTSPTTWSALNTSGGVTSTGSIHNDGAGTFDYGL